MSLLAAVPDYVLKARAEQKDQEAHDELVRRGLRWDPATVKRTRVCRDKAERRERKFQR